MKINDIVKEATIKAYDGKRVTIDDPEHGKTIDLDLTKPENAASLRPNDKGELEFDSTPDMGAVGATDSNNPLKPGAQVSIKADEGGVTLPNPDGSQPPGAFTVQDQIALNQRVQAQASGATAGGVPIGSTPPGINRLTGKPIQSAPTQPASAAPSTPHVPKDYQTKEPLTKGQDGKWRNSKGEERDGLHGGPVNNGAAMFRSLTPRSAPAPVPESTELTAMLRIAGLR